MVPCWTDLHLPPGLRNLDMIHTPQTRCLWQHSIFMTVHMSPALERWRGRSENTCPWPACHVQGSWKRRSPNQASSWVGEELPQRRQSSRGTQLLRFDVERRGHLPLQGYRWANTATRMESSATGGLDYRMCTVIRPTCRDGQLHGRWRGRPLCDCRKLSVNGPTRLG